MRILTEAEIRVALQNRGIEVIFKYDYSPSPRQDKAVYEVIDFIERAWRALLLVATGRRKLSKKLNRTQTALKRGPLLYERGQRVRVLTFNAAVRLQNAGYELECLGNGYQGPVDSNYKERERRIGK